MPSCNFRVSAHKVIPACCVHVLKQASGIHVQLSEFVNETISANSLFENTVNQSCIYAMLQWCKDNPIPKTLNDQNPPYRYHFGIFTVGICQGWKAGKWQLLAIQSHLYLKLYNRKKGPFFHQTWFNEAQPQICHCTRRCYPTSPVQI